MSEQRFYSRLDHWVRANLAAWAQIRARHDWLRSSRRAQGLKGVELAKRMHLSAARISMLERDEARGAVTLKMMRRAADALDCEFVYLLVPKQSLKQADSPGAKPVQKPGQKPRLRLRSGA